MQGIIRSTVEGFRNVPSGNPNPMADDFIECVRWQIPLTEIRIPVYIWHGGRDENVGAMGAYLAKQIPGAIDHFYPDEGHFLAFKYMQEILEELCPV